MQSGITCDEFCVPTFNEMKMQKNSQYIIYKIQEDKNVVVESKGARGTSYDDFLKALPDKQARYAVFDYFYKNEENREINKIIFIYWCAKGTPIQNKFIYTATKEEIKSKLQGINLSYEVNERSDIDSTIINKDLSKY